VPGFPSGAWETAKSLHDLSKVNCLETKLAQPEPNEIAGSQAPLGNSQAGSSRFPFVFVARAQTYGAGLGSLSIVPGFPSGAWETAKSLRDLSKVNRLENSA
jgi:hypothetical protein